MNIIFFGTPNFVIPVIKKLREEHTVVAIVTTPDQKVGRKQILTPSPAKQYGIETNIPVHTPEKLTPVVIDELSQYESELIIVASYGLLIPKAILTLPRYGALNIHPSLLPKFRGASPIQATILSGDTEGGVTIIKMDEELDHGPVIAQIRHTITNTDTSESLLPVLFEKGVSLLLDNLPAYVSGKLTPEPQNHTQATFCGRLTKEDAYISSTTPPDKVTLDRMIRAYTPWPIVWTTVLLRAVEIRLKLYPGNMVQLEGSKKMTAKELINGYPELEEILKTLLTM